MHSTLEKSFKKISKRFNINLFCNESDTELFKSLFIIFSNGIAKIITLLDRRQTVNKIPKFATHINFPTT